VSFLTRTRRISVGVFFIACARIHFHSRIAHRIPSSWYHKDKRTWCQNIKTWEILIWHISRKGQTTGIGKSLFVSGIECHNSYIVIYELDNRYTDLLSRSTYNIAQTCPETQADAFCRGNTYVGQVSGDWVWCAHTFFSININACCGQTLCSDTSWMCKYFERWSR
jgi:hypothetical protein